MIGRHARNKAGSCKNGGNDNATREESDLERQNLQTRDPACGVLAGLPLGVDDAIAVHCGNDRVDETIAGLSYGHHDHDNHHLRVHEARNEQCDNHDDKGDNDRILRPLKCLGSRAAEVGTHDGAAIGCEDVSRQHPWIKRDVSEIVNRRSTHHEVEDPFCNVTKK